MVKVDLKTGLDLVRKKRTRVKLKLN